MTIDLEARLARAMHGAVEPEQLWVDPDTVLAQGKRAVRRRRTATAGGAAVAILLAGGITAGVSSLPSHRTYTSVPAASVTAGSDAPVQGPFGVGHARFDPAASAISVTLPDSEGHDETTTVPVSSLVRTPEGRSGFRILSPDAVLVVVPERAGHVTVLTDTRTSPSFVGGGTKGPDLVIVPGSGLAVGVAEFIDWKKAPRVTGVRWTSGDRMVDSVGGRYETTRVPQLPDGLLWVCSNGEGGLQSSEGGWTWPDVDALGVGAWGSSSVGVGPDTPGASRIMLTGAVPAGSRDVAFDWPAGWTPEPIGTVAIPGRDVLFVVGRATRPDQSVADLGGTIPLSWTDATGARHRSP